jgi:rhodanese-related sulfurtransferase
MGLPAWRTGGAVRLSFGPLATDDFIDEACARIRRCGQAARRPLLVASPSSGAPNGLLQVSAEGRHGWILFDPAAGACVVVDPPASLAMRIAAHISASGLRVAAVLGTGADPDGGAARVKLCTALRTVLGAALGPDTMAAGALGWPQDGGVAMLADGSAAPAIALGDEVLVRRASEGEGGAAYLLGRAHEGRLEAGAVRLAFVGGIVMAGGLADAGARGLVRLLDDATVLCHGADIGGVPCATVAGLRAAPANAGQAQPLQLPWERLDAFLRTHEDALLVDVREACELEAGSVRLHGREAQALPLSRLAEHLGRLLAAPRRPLVFVCRSGNRSARAALCLQQLGHAQAWSLAGGLALAVGPEPAGT